MATDPAPAAPAAAAPDAEADADATAGAADGDVAGETPGGGVVVVDFAATGVFLAFTVLAVVLPESVGPVAAGVDVALFAAGLVAFLWAYGVAVQRSRVDEMSIGGVYFLTGDTAPALVRTRLRIGLATQVVAAVAAASIRPFTVVAFAVLVPMFGLGLMGLWGARHGRFPPRPTTT